MTPKALVLDVVLAVFLVLTGYAVWQHGYLGVLGSAFLNSATAQIFVDLCIALTLILFWMWEDARRHAISPLPFALLTLALGSIGPLVYLIRREFALRAAGRVQPAQFRA
jgi:hypothetical protein